VREFLTEFRKFVMRGNLLQLAVAFIMSLYFKDVIDTFTNGIILPFVAAIFGEANFTQIGFDVGDSRVFVGAFLNAVINFVIVAFILFLIIRAYEAMMARIRTHPEEAEPLTPSEELLTEIRDLLRSRA
jgi:large conductance mechanosensitive channel